MKIGNPRRKEIFTSALQYAPTCSFQMTTLRGSETSEPTDINLKSMSNDENSNEKGDAKSVICIPPSEESGEVYASVFFEDLEELPKAGPVAKLLAKSSKVLVTIYQKHKAIAQKIFWGGIFCFYNVYLAWALYLAVTDAENKNKDEASSSSSDSVMTNIDWCEGVGFLIVFTALVYTYGNESSG